MSRIIVKNIPNGFDELKLRNHFSACGIVTDVQLKYTPEGKFRNFGYIGYETEEQANNAIKHFNNSFIRTSKINVATCVALNESKHLKTWSKHCQKPTDSTKKLEETPAPSNIAKTKAPNAKDVLESYKDDPKFQEFIDAHKRAGKSLWDNQFQKSNILPTTAFSDENSDSGNAESDQEQPTVIKKTQETKKSSKTSMIPLFVAKVHNIPASTKRQDLIRFFKSAKPYSVRIPPKLKGFAYVGFKTEIDLNKALLMNKSFLGGKQVKIYNFYSRSEQISEPKGEKHQKLAKWERQKANKSTETICESGKLFFRNLSYSVQEEDIRKIFEKYGPVSEVDVPIDSSTQRLKGFGTVTFLMPEHAVMAYNELNGTFLQGRMFHILPAIVQYEDNIEGSDPESSNYKRKKEHGLRKTAQLTHNWNTLFMGENAVAEAVARKYSTTKEKILLSSEGESSAAVRLALGETELVIEMQNFLQENNISLDAFNSKDVKRSNTIILVKNLDPRCSKEALRNLFSPFGILGRVVLPPSAVTAVVEFLDPSEARKAFKKLAYTMFQSLPLFLEWAPQDTFKIPFQGASVVDVKNPDKQNSNSNVRKDAIDSNNSAFTATDTNSEAFDETTEPEDGTTLFIKNLNFITSEVTIREHFCGIGTIHSVQVVRSRDHSGADRNESRGYGFIQFKKRQVAENALKNLQFTLIDGRQVELARSDRTLKTAHDSLECKKLQTGSKIVVRNIPFQASANEVRDLFKPFGDIKSLRLPNKMAASLDESHRGFCFVEFVREPEAKRAFEALGRSTHLYGRRLVLEWAAPDDGIEELRKRTADHFHHTEGASATAKRSSNHRGLMNANEFVASSASNRKSFNDDEEEFD